MAKKKSKADLVQEIFAEAANADTAASRIELASLYAIASYWARKAGVVGQRKKVSKPSGKIPTDRQIAKV